MTLPQCSECSARNVYNECHHCQKPLCDFCIEACETCNELFCNLCSIKNYDLNHTRSFCLNCQVPKTKIKKIILINVRKKKKKKLYQNKKI